MAAAILKQDSFSITLPKNFKPNDFRSNMKDKMLEAGSLMQHTTFILTDSQIMAESFLEDVNNILNTGEITNLYEREDNEKIGVLRS